MEIEQWLEEAMIITNKALRLIPSSVFKQCLETCRREGVSLEAIVNAGNEVGLVNKAKLLEFKERIAQPRVTPPSQEEVLAVKRNYQPSIEASRLLANYFIGAAKQIPVTLDFQALDEKAAKGFGKVMESLMRQAANNNKTDKTKEDKDGDRNNNPA